MKTPSESQLTDEQFEAIGKLAKKLWGLDIEEGKRVLVDNRILSLVRTRRIEDFATWYAKIFQDDCRQERLLLFDALSTNLTSFFRDPGHFDLLERNVLKPWRDRPSPGPLRIWSAGCSWGAEPCSLAMKILECIPRDRLSSIHILASDYSTSCLQKARKAVYPTKMVQDLSQERLESFFLRGKGAQEGYVRARPEIRKMIRFELINLMQPWKHSSPFQAIFCRNVMIYFDLETRAALVERFIDNLQPGGLLFFGTSENLPGRISGLDSLGSSAYERPVRPAAGALS